MPDEPRIAKYGLPASYSQQYEATQTSIAFEREVRRELHFLHALDIGPSLRAALDAVAGEGAAPAPVAEVPPSVVTATPAAPKPIDLRAALGLR